MSLAAFLLPGASAREPVAPPALKSATAPGRGQRVIVFAPHPDDETLGVGGLIHRAVRAGARVRIVFLTSGDGFTLGQAARGEWPGHEAMRRFGALREGEAAVAAAALGLPASALSFLRYPDRGLASLWLHSWSAAYASLHTGRRSTPEGAPYTGKALLARIEALLADERPDFVYYPDPADDHPDHWAAHGFIRLALERTGPAPTALTYLVHRGRWPSAGAPLSPPQELTEIGARWETAALPASAANAKRCALRSHRSQLPLAGEFLGRFLTSNELLSEWPPAVGPAVLADPVRDRWGRARLAGGDIASVEVAAEKDLRFRLRLRGRKIPGAEYRLYWKPVEGTPGSLTTRSVDLTHGNATVALRELRGARRIMLGAEVWLGPVLLDRTPWRVVRVSSL